MIKAVITDIEGTITDIDFVHKVLFPYSRQKMSLFLQENATSKDITPILADIRQIMGNPKAELAAISQQLIQWIDEDQKIGPLKSLQGYIWQQGFYQGEYRGHIYEDAYQNLLKWHQQGIKLYVYSSGSVHAQQLLLQHSTFGDVRYLFSGYFDTNIGSKKEPTSYANIIKEIQCDAKDTCFLSDVASELAAAQQNGIQTRLIDRYHQQRSSQAFMTSNSFDEISW